MNSKKNSAEKSQYKSLRLWPGITLAIILLILSYIIPIIIPGALIVSIFGGLIIGLGIIIWWSFFSRAPRIERWLAIILIIASLIITSFFNHVSIATGGQGTMYFIFGIPLLCLVFVAWAIITKSFSNKVRRITMILTIILASGWWILVRTDGITGDFVPDLRLRWSETSEEQLLTSEIDTLVNLADIEVSRKSEAEWPGFRGPKRDGIIKGIKINSDWKSNPPKELWRRPIGPGCSSFAVNGDLIYTQEQRGEVELVVCYYLKTGEPIWKHEDKARFWDSHAGAGPRSTPTLNKGRIYTLGATGILNALDARDGTLLWSRNAVSDSDVVHSGWGYTSSPLVVDDIVIVAAVGKLVAYDIETGKLRWMGPDGGDSYSSPHLLTIDGIQQVVLMSGKGVTSILPSVGEVLWEYKWQIGSRIVQPAMTSDGEILISYGEGKGLRRIVVKHNSGDWSIENRWTSNQLKPNFNDFVIHEDHAYGFNGPILACIEINEGQRKWRGRRYGGQLILLADQDLIIILSEQGELALVEANPEKFKELARLEAIEGKTWNHPVLVGGILLVRNGQEMVAYQVSSITS